MSQSPSEQKPAVTARLAEHALKVWLLALLLFLVWLGITLSSGQPGAQNPAPFPESVAGNVNDPGYILTDMPAWHSLPTPAMPFDTKQEHVLVAFGLQGFSQSSINYPDWSISLQQPVLEAQLITRGPNPRVVRSDVRITWELEAGTRLASGSAHSTPQEIPLLRGEMTPPQGNSLSYTATIPVQAQREDGSTNPYPLVTLTAIDMESGREIARTAAVLAVSPGFSCMHCHDDAEHEILRVHDRREGSKLAEMAKNGQVVQCRSCHSGPAMLSGKLGAGYGLSVSAAMHAWHAQYLSERGGDACLTCHIGLGQSEDTEGTRPLFMRDLHQERGLDCTTCHGAMEDHALALLKAEQTVGQKLAEPALARITPQSVDHVNDINARLPWTQQPDCAGCHNFSEKPRLGEVSGFNHWTAEGSSLFSQRSDMANAVRCATCHGAPHAMYPAKNPLGRDRDNIAPMQYQAHARTLGAAGNCAMCHTVSMPYPVHHPLAQRNRTHLILPDSVELTLPEVMRFSHQAHANIECEACHHTGRVDGVSMSCTSQGCHDSSVQYDAQGEDVGSRYYRVAFHGPYPSCYACHTMEQDMGNPAGPLACKDCHMTASPRWGNAHSPMP